MTLQHNKYKLNSVVVYLDPDKEKSGLFRVNDITRLIAGDCESEPTYELENVNGDQIETSEKLIKPIEIVYVCIQCGNIHIQSKSWTDLNTEKFEGFVDEGGECGEYYCDNCEETVNDIVLVGEFYKDDVITLKANNHV